MDKHAVQATNALKQWVTSLMILAEAMRPTVHQDTGVVTENGDEPIGEKVDELIEMMKKRISEIQVKGYRKKGKE